MKAIFIRRDPKLWNFDEDVTTCLTKCALIYVWKLVQPMRLWDCGWLHLLSELDPLYSSCINSSATMRGERSPSVLIQLWLQYARLYPLSHRSAVPQTHVWLTDWLTWADMPKVVLNRWVTQGWPHHTVRCNEKMGNTCESYTPTAVTQY